MGHTTLARTCASAPWRHVRGDRTAKVCAAIGIAALLLAAPRWLDTGGTTIADMADAGGPEAAGSARPATPTGSALSGLDRRFLIGGYSGVAYTHPSTVTIRDRARTDMTVKDFSWIGRPFKAPIYYGVRGIAWPEGSRFGAMIDFTHAKAIANYDDIGTFSGTADGRPLPAKARMRDVFKHLEFSHGHNMVTFNGMARLGLFVPHISPYLGIGGGISLPHTEVALRSENGRTYEYQYTGLVGQALAGLEIRLGRISLFFEYKYSYAPYDVPLSGVVNGWLLVTDLWRQLTAWLSGEKPPRGTLQTTLKTHHAIGGVLVRVNR